MRNRGTTVQCRSTSWAYLSLLLAGCLGALGGTVFAQSSAADKTAPGNAAAARIVAPAEVELR